MELAIGDKLRIVAPLGFYHYGIYVGRRGAHGEDVIHNNKSGGVELVSLEDFAAGLPVEIAERGRYSFHEREAIARRALSLVGREYRLIDFNCEHAANYALTGVATSPAIAAVVTLSVIGLCVWAASRS